MPVVAETFRSEEAEALFAVLGDAFNLPAPQWAGFRRRIGDDGFLIARSGGRIVGGCGVYATGQVFLGREIRMAGVAGVGVAPHARGRGIAVALMEEVLRRQAAQGVPIAALFPATQTVYRRAGYELAGDRWQYEAPLAAIGAPRPTVEIRPVEDEEELKRRYRPAHGNLARCPAMWDRLLRGNGPTRSSFLLGDEGYVVLQRSPEGDPHGAVEVLDLAAPDTDTARSLLGLLAGYRSMARTLRWYGQLDDELLAALDEPCWSVSGHQRWMLRIVRLVEALEGRGWPEGAEGELHLEVEDPVLAENSGRFVLRVEGGRAGVARGGRGSLRVPMGSFGPLYSGLSSASTLARRGRIEGSAQELARADRLFQSPHPWMREMF